MNEFLEKKERIKKKRSKKKWAVVIFFLLLTSFIGLFSLKTGFTIERIIGSEEEPSFSRDPNLLPKDDPDRINILLLGIRDDMDKGEGLFLSDTIILASVDKKSDQAAIISLPRDLYHEIWCVDGSQKQKINFTYAQGGFSCAKKTISWIAGVYVDYAVSVNFEALEETIDSLGGITLYLPAPFEERSQWTKEGEPDKDYWKIEEINGEEKWVFHLPSGRNDLNGEAALYYTRSRFSTSDFDRMRRQQQVILAIKEKALSLKFLANPVKIYNFLDILGSNVKTDMSLKEINNLINLSSSIDSKNIKRKIFDTTPEGLLYEEFIDDKYVLLPVNNDFGIIQKAVKNIFD